MQTNISTLLSRYSDACLVTAATDKRFRVWVDGCTIDLLYPGKWRVDSGGVRPLAPGDVVRIDFSRVKPKIGERLERLCEFTRRAAGPKPLPQTMAANPDVVAIIASAANPTTPFGLVDRLLATAALGGVPAFIFLNKTDLVEASTIAEWERIYRDADVQVQAVSAQTRQGVGDFQAALTGRMVLLAGSSGVGKSSLINLWDPSLNLRTGLISEATGKGRHVTTSASLFATPGGGWVIDTPGLRECAPWGLVQSKVAECFPEIKARTGGCRFRNCLHKGEAGCEVGSAVDSGQIAAERYRSYCKLLNESE